MINRRKLCFLIIFSFIFIIFYEAKEAHAVRVKSGNQICSIIGYDENEQRILGNCRAIRDDETTTTRIQPCPAGGCVPFGEIPDGLKASCMCPFEETEAAESPVFERPSSATCRRRLSPPYEICEPVMLPTAGCGGGCDCSSCQPAIRGNHERMRAEFYNQFKLHRTWMIDVYFIDNIARAMAQMTSQMTAVSMQQMKILGSFFDAKHQLETQRLFQQLMAQAHKDYQPSRGMCDITTNVRGLLTGERKTDLATQVLSNRGMDRQLRTGHTISEENNSDLYSRVDIFRSTFCQLSDNADGLFNLCMGTSGNKAMINKDIDYTRTIESELTLSIDFSGDILNPDAEEPGTGAGQVSNDERATFALMSHLVGHEVLPNIGKRILATEDGRPRIAAYKYLDLRAVAAKRSVAMNSISSIIGERASGQPVEETEYAPFMKKVIVDLGVPPDEVNFILGQNPSYFAQMEVLTKKLYQNPIFYTELYDKPTNVLRKRAAIRAINLMQDRDLYKSLLRSEAVLSVILEGMLSDEHRRVYEYINRLEPSGDPVNE